MSKIILDQQIPSGHLVIRYPQASDAEAMTEYINTLSREQTFIRFQGKQITLEDEVGYLNGQLKKISDHLSVQLLAVIDEKLVGITGIEMLDHSEAHVGTFGISLARDARSKGIGKLLMATVIDEAIKNMDELKIITLTCFANNEVGLSMYRKFGFIEHGRLPDGVQRKGEYTDHIYMYKKVR